MKINWLTTLRTVEITVVSSVSGFLASIGTTTGGSFDAKHLQAAGIAALLGLAYKLSGVLSATLSQAAATPDPVPVPVPAPVPPAAPVVPPAPVPAPVPPVVP